MKKFLVFSLMFSLVAPLLAFAQTDTLSSVASTNIIQPSVVVKAYDGVCASNAIISYENNQQTIIETRQASMKVAAVARRDALGAAYLLTDKTVRNIAIEKAHNVFLTAQKSADKTAMDAAKTEKKLFKIAMKGCGAMLPPMTSDQINNQNSFENNGNQIGINQNPNFPRIPKQGVRGEDVKNIQKKLGLKIDGVFGPGTTLKVKEWQAKKGLKQDGIIGKESLAKIETEGSEENAGNQAVGGESENN